MLSLLRDMCVRTLDRGYGKLFERHGQWNF